MRKTTLILAFLVVVLCGRAQDFLTPESYGIYNYFENGNETLFRLLITGETFEGSATWEGGHSTFYLCTPSFSPEYALVIGKDQLVLNKAKENIGYYITAEAYSQAPDFNTRNKKQRKQILNMINRMQSTPVDRFTLSISKEQSGCIATLFRYATLTATHLQSATPGIDGTEFYFNYREKLASVWEPQGGRIAQLVTMADSLCYAVEHHDTVVLNRQMEVCKNLIRSFKKEFPLSYFQHAEFSCVIYAVPGICHCRHVGEGSEVFMQLDVLSDSAVSGEICSNVLRQYTDSLASWSREIFLMSDNPCYPSVIIDNHTDSAICMVEQNDRGFERKITMPETYWRREVILSTAQLPPGQYYFSEEAWRDSKSSLLEEAIDMSQPADTEEYYDSDGAIVEWFCCSPEFPGGNDSLQSFLKKNIQFPIGYEKVVNGIVLVEITVEIDGSITNPRIRVSLTPELDAEAIRVVKLMPKWVWPHPEQCYGGIIRRCFYNIPIKFDNR
ncbi:MAG: energy transducer TonB [Bacteroidales bacterium]|nr:energy transducer TonB [Bacteroidales bacterium]